MFALAGYEIIRIIQGVYHLSGKGGSIMEFEEVQALRKSSRSYTDEPVSEKDIAALIHAAGSASVGMHNDKGYAIAVVTAKSVLSAIAEDMKKIGKGDPLYGAPLLFVICETKDAIEFLKRYDAGIMAEHLQLQAAALGLGSVILYGFIRHLGENASYLKKMKLPEGVKPLLAVAVGHAKGADLPRKSDRHFTVLTIDE